MTIVIYSIIAAVFFWFVTYPLFCAKSTTRFEDSDATNKRQRMEELLSDLELDFALNNISEAEYNKLKSSYDRTQ